MVFLVAGLVAAVLLILLPRFIGRRSDRMLGQYEVLEKRFGLKRQTTSSRWGKGLKERYSLSGVYRGYPLSLYSHFKKRAGRRAVLTSLVFEALFADEIELRLSFAGTKPSATFDDRDGLFPVGAGVGVSLFSNVDLADYLGAESLQSRLQSFAKKDVCGAILLSKGFIEYRETGVMESEAQRLRFQEAMLLLGHLCDALSVYQAELKL